MVEQSQGQQTPNRPVRGGLVEVGIAVAILAGLAVWHFHRPSDVAGPVVKPAAVAVPKSVAKEAPKAAAVPEKKRQSKAEIKAARRLANGEHSYQGPFGH